MNKIIALAVLLLTSTTLLSACGTRASDVPLPGLVTQRKEAADITVSVAPPGDLTIGNSWDFQLKLESDSVDLNQDLAGAAVLVANNQEYPALAWEGSTPDGSYREGILKFTRLEPIPDIVELKLRDLNDAEFSFGWDFGAAPCH